MKVLSNVVLNTLDSGKNVDKGKVFLKGKTLKASCNSFPNHIDEETESNCVFK